MTRSDSRLHIEVRAVEAALAQQFGREPTDERVATAVGVDTARLRAQRAAHFSCQVTSIGRPGVYQEVEATGSPDAETTLNRADDLIAVTQAMAQLSERERYVLALRYFRGLSQSDIAPLVGVSQMQISRILGTSTNQLRGLVNPPETTTAGLAAAS